MKIALVFIGVIGWAIIMACCKMSGECFEEEEERDGYR